MTLNLKQETELLTIGYITGRFPTLSMVFEQNELLGLIAAGAQVDYLSCRKAKDEDIGSIHQFARPLLHLAKYPSIFGILNGFFWCCFTRPTRLVKIVYRTLHAIIIQPGNFRHYCSTLVLSWQFSRLGYRNNWERIHANFAQGTATTAWNIAELLDMPFSFTAHAFDIYGSKYQRLEHKSFFTKKIDAASLVLFISQDGRNHVREKYGFDVSRSRLHRVTVRTEEMQMLPPPESSIPRIITLGRLFPKKGIDRFIKAIHKLRKSGIEVKAEVYGDGFEYENLRMLIEELELQKDVSLMGKYRQEDLPEIFSRAFALVVPSIRTKEGDMDGIPTVIYETMAFGRPVIASSIAGIPEVIKHEETGILVEPDNVEAITEAISDLIADHGKVERIVKAAREYVTENHDYIKGGQRLYQLLKRASNPAL